MNTTTCPDCDQDVVVTDNNVRLDAAPDPAGDWHIMHLGAMRIAGAGGPPQPGRPQYHLHAHQPAETNS